MDFTEMFSSKEFAFMPYVCLGYPTLGESVRIIRALEPSADAFELGLPFSDPVADGPVLQKASQKALASGFHTTDVFKAVREVREFTQKPLAIMSYANPLLAYGTEKFAFDAFAAGVDALLVPDAPLEEIGFVKKACAGKLEVPLFVSPTTTPERCKKIAEETEGFVYAIAVKGVTGERAGFTEDVAALVKRIPGKPVVLGFGVSGREQADLARKAGARGVIVGSKIVRAFEENGLQGVKEFAEAMKELRE